MDSNISEFLQQNYQATNTFRLLSVPLALQKYYKRYYCSSSFGYADFTFTDYDTSYYEPLIMLALSNSNVTFELVGAETTRCGKLEYISKFDISKEELNVCVMEAENCSKCGKCKRTMLGLYLLGVLDEFNQVFDVEYFYNNKQEFIWWALENKNATDMDEIVSELKNRRELTSRDAFIVSRRKIVKKCFVPVKSTFIGVFFAVGSKVKRGIFKLIKR